MSQIGNTVPDGAKFKELFTTLWKGKIIIAVFIAAAIVLSSVINFFILTEQYTATSVLMISISEMDTTDLEDVPTIITDTVKMPVLTSSSYLQQFKSSAILEKTIKDLDLKDDSGNYISSSVLSGSIGITQVANTNLVEITVTNPDPESAMRIANSLSGVFIDYVAESYRNSVKKVIGLLEEQMGNEERNLKESSDALVRYWSQNNDINLLTEKIEDLTDQIVDYDKKYQDAETQIASDKEALKVLISALDPDDIASLKDFNLGIDLEDDPVPADQDKDQVIIPSNKDQVIIPSNNVSSTLLLLNISKVQTSLISNSAKLASLKNGINEMETTLTKLNTQLTENEYLFDELDNSMELSKKYYYAYQQIHKRLSLMADSIETSIYISADAVLPGSPASPNKMLNIFVTTCFALCLGVFIVLYRSMRAKAPASSEKEE